MDIETLSDKLQYVALYLAVAIVAAAIVEKIRCFIVV